MEKQLSGTAWWYVDSWSWAKPTWGTGQGQWVFHNSTGPNWVDDWTANFDAKWMEENIQAQGAKALVRKFRWTGTQWLRVS